MRQLRIALLIIVSVLCGTEYSPSLYAQNRGIFVDWKAELTKAKAGVAKNPKSSFWHNQAGVAYDALGDFRHAEKELKLASALDPTNSFGDYTLYFFYKRKEMFWRRRRQLLFSALEKDPENPLGHFELGLVLEKEKYWEQSLSQYKEAKLLSAKVKGPEYIDPRGNPFDLGTIRSNIAADVDRIAKIKLRSAKPVQ